MIRIPATRARACLYGLTRQVARGGSVVVLTVRGRPMAALVPLSVLDLAEGQGRTLPSLADAAAGLRDPSVGARALRRGQGGG